MFFFFPGCSVKNKGINVQGNKESHVHYRIWPAKMEVVGGKVEAGAESCRPGESLHTAFPKPMGTITRFLSNEKITCSGLG